MSELKPCPFCGGEATIASLGGDEQNWWLGCMEECKYGFEVGVSGLETLDDLKQAWNTRQSRKAQIADALTDMRRRGYFDGGLMVQLIAKEMDAGLEDVQKFLNALINVCEGGGE